jgi:uncharacterized protein
MELQEGLGERPKHGVTFQEACTLFGDSLARIHDDPDHSAGENREIIVGRSSGGALLLVCFVERTESVRLISARHATARERHDYQEAIK